MYIETPNSSCIECPSGKWSVYQSSSCRECAAGRWSHARSRACTTCPTGTFITSPSSFCRACPEGTWSLPGAVNCTPFDTGKCNTVRVERMEDLQSTVRPGEFDYLEHYLAQPS